MLHRLETADLDRTLTQPDHDEHVRALAEQVEADQTRLTDLAETFAEGPIGRSEWMTARAKVEPRLEANRRALAMAQRRDALAEYVGRGHELRGAWDGPHLTRQIAIVKAVLAGATIMPAAVPGRHGLDPNRVQPHWRV